jgi:hypothetical protein
MWGRGGWGTNPVGGQQPAVVQPISFTILLE